MAGAAATEMVTLFADPDSLHAEWRVGTGTTASPNAVASMYGCIDGNRIGPKKDPEGPFPKNKSVAKEYYFLAAGFAAFFGTTALGAAFAFGATVAGVTGTAFNAAR